MANEDKKGSLIQLSFNLLSNSKQALENCNSYNRGKIFKEVVPIEDEHKYKENYNSFAVHDTRMLKNQPTKSSEIPKHSSVASSVQDKIVELKNIFFPKALEEKENINQNNEQYNNSNIEEKSKDQSSEDWQPM